MTPTISRVLFTSIVALALTGAPNAVFGKHHGGGSHGGGSRGGGGFHSGKRGGGGFHGGGGGHSGGKSFLSVRSAAPRQTGGGSSRRFGGLTPRANSNSAYFGGHMAGSNGPRRINASAGGRLGSSDVRAMAAGTRATGMNFGSNRPPSVASPARSWSSQGPSSRASTPRSTSSFDSNRPPSAVSASRSWSRQGPSSGAATPRSASSFNPNRPPSAASAARSWSGQGPSSRASTPKSTSFFDQNRGLGNFGDSQFGNYSFGRSSLSYARNESSVRHFGGSRFGGARQFELGATSFNRETSFGGDDFSLVPDLFGLALNLGGFGLRGLGLLLTGFRFERDRPGCRPGIPTVGARPGLISERQLRLPPVTRLKFNCQI